MHAQEMQNLLCRSSWMKLRPRLVRQTLTFLCIRCLSAVQVCSDVVGSLAADDNGLTIELFLFPLVQFCTTKVTNHISRSLSDLTPVFPLHTTSASVGLANMSAQQTPEGMLYCNGQAQILTLTSPLGSKIINIWSREELCLVDHRCTRCAKKFSQARSSAHQACVYGYIGFQEDNLSCRTRILCRNWPCCIKDQSYGSKCPADS